MLLWYPLFDVCLTTEQGILPVGKMQAPPKPWEKQRQAASAVEDVSIAAGLSGGRNMLDQKFPPMGGDDVLNGGGGAGEGAAALKTAA